MIQDLETSLERLRALSPDDYEGAAKIRALWEGLAGRDERVVQHLYALYIETLRGLFGKAAGAGALTGLDAYKFILCFCSLSYSRNHAAAARAWRALVAFHAEHIEFIKAGLERPDETITAIHTRTQTGRWGDIVAAMFELYFWCRPLAAETDETIVETANLLPQFYRSFPEERGGPIHHFLEAHPQEEEVVTELIRFYVLERGQADKGPMMSVFDDLMGQATFRSKITTRNAAILKAVLKDVRSWPSDRIRLLIDFAVLGPLHIRPISQSEKAEDLRRTIALQRRRLNEKTQSDYMGIPAEEQRGFDGKHLRQSEEELRFVETDFAGWNRRRRETAVQSLAVSAAGRRAVKIICARLSAPYRLELQSLLDEAAAYSARPKLFALSPPASNRFKDFGLKLLVIEELMYRQKRLRPVFDVDAFAKEYTKREISVEMDGYAVIPEVARYFRALPISDEALAHVERLHQSSGLDGGPEFIRHFFPFWDPGVGDEPVPVTSKAIEDLALLPNLKQISGLENSRPAPRLLKALQARGIKLIKEEDVR
ncbi:DUF6892 domain-containing protein [Acidocella sp.]|uniref:DUF6892 domain-containing protein n=1 Tax=Acidocella sp. TaxID=50710 RepID=UPI003D08A802